MESCVIELTEAAHKYGNLNIRPCGKEFFPSDRLKKEANSLPAVSSLDASRHSLSIDRLSNGIFLSINEYRSF